MLNLRHSYSNHSIRILSSMPIFTTIFTKFVPLVATIRKT